GLEKTLADLNTKKADLEGKLASPDTYAQADAFRKTEVAYQQVLQQLEKANKDYETVFEKIMELESGLTS
ncbi:MAG TPA: hypothetical protein VHK69_02015, partial [Chitinophagaceae bacterium]|nr:hypothetical protein [Chitinophagaceae bacterium]